MNVPRSIALLLASLAALAPLAAATTGPYVGTVRQGEVDAHHYDNNPKGDPCLQIVTTYTVTLAYAPAGDVLTLTVGTRSVSGNGASVTFTAGVCTAFDFTVTGTQVADLAAYDVTVTSGLLSTGGWGFEWG